jgi:hypothetical protein
VASVTVPGCRHRIKTITGGFNRRAIWHPDQESWPPPVAKANRTLSLANQNTSIPNGG